MLSSSSSSFLGSHPTSSSPPLLQQSLRHTNPSSRHFNVLLSQPTFFPHSHPPPPPPQQQPPMKPTIATAAALLTSTNSAFFALNSQRRRRLLLTVQCGSKSGEVSGAAAAAGGGIEWRKKSEGTHNNTQSTRPSSSSSSSTPPSNRVPNGSRNMQRKVRPGEGIPSQKGSRRTSEVDSDKIKGRKNTVLEDGITPAPSKRIKPPKIKEQVKILSPLNNNPNVAILGGGMSGIMCALALQEKGIRSTVFDTGKHGLGGRMGTRHIAQLNGSPLVFEHGAQYFTATDPSFKKLVNQWLDEGAVREWNGVVGTLEKGGNFTESQPCTKYVATDGMRLLADHLLSKRQLIEVRRPCWISKMLESGGMWHLFENEKDHGDYDIVIIAHNGKCANRLLGPVGVPLVAKQMKRLELSSIWALMAAFEKPLPSVISGNRNIQLGGAFVKGIDAVSWIGNNTAKLNPSEINGPYCWTFFSTAAYGKKNKVPQESIPTARAERVKREMLQGVEMAFGLEEGSLPTPLFMRVQLWGAALPVNTPNIPCIFDANGRVGICGDWLLGSNLQAAALSGMAMANQISKFSERGGLNPDEFNIGLEEWLSPIGGHDIGEFAGLELTGEPVRKLQAV